MKAYVTGGAGFIGSNIANQLAEEGHEVVVIDNEYLGTRENLRDDVRFHEASVMDEYLPGIEGVDAVFHLAALSSLGMHRDNPVEGAKVNVAGFVNVVEQAREEGAEDVVYASTSSIYGTADSPCNEQMEVESGTRYEASKLARERYGEMYSNQYGMNMAALRPFSIYQGMEYNEGHKNGYANVVSQFARKMANGDHPEIFGDGTQTRDLLHVEDAARGFRKARGLDGVYNLGTGESYSFNEVVGLINGELGTDIEPKYIENPYEDFYVYHTWADSSKLMKKADWRPKIRFGEEGVERVCEPYQT